MIFRYKIKFISNIEQKIRKLLVNIAVAPFVGVWIEILYRHFYYTLNMNSGHIITCIIIYICCKIMKNEMIIWHKLI